MVAGSGKRTPGELDGFMASDTLQQIGHDTSACTRLCALRLSAMDRNNGFVHTPGFEFECSRNIFTPLQSSLTSLSLTSKWSGDRSYLSSTNPGWLNDGIDVSHDWSRFFESMHFDALRDLELGGFVIDIDDFKRFLLRHAWTLRYLHLSKLVWGADTELGFRTRGLAYEIGEKMALLGIECYKLRVWVCDDVRCENETDGWIRNAGFVEDQMDWDGEVENLGMAGWYNGVDRKAVVPRTVAFTQHWWEVPCYWL